MQDHLLNHLVTVFAPGTDPAAVYAAETGVEPLSPASPASSASSASPASSASSTACANHDVLELFVAGKRPATRCEDAIVVCPGYLAVFDGMSSPFGKQVSPSTGWLASTAAADALLQVRQEAGAEEVVAALADAVAAVRPEQLDGPFGTVCAIYSRHRRQIWRVGDIALRIGETEYPAGKRVDTAMVLFRQAVNHGRLAGGMPLGELLESDPGLRAAEPLLRVQHHLANRVGPLGYGVLDGLPVPAEYLEILPVGSEIEQIVLASDGFVSAAPSFAQAESALAQALARDPACINELSGMGKAPKNGIGMPDDRAYLRFRLSASN